ncbi:MAG: 4Fe-4S binding protein [Phycisphaerae bacterium]|nr:4Fe-4S binding protein [Phycisphaerae bacterium]
MPGHESLAVEVGGLRWRNPFLVGSGPTTKRVDQLIEADRRGWGGASIKLVIDPPPYINRQPRYRWSKRDRMHFFTAEKRLTLDEGLRLIEDGRRAAPHLNLLANITYAGEAGLEGWAAMAGKFEAAGAHAIELNFCCPNMSYNLEVTGTAGGDRPSSGASLGRQPVVVRDITLAVKRAVSVPVFCKLTPEGGNIAQVAKAAFEAGADAVGGTANRLGLVDFDIHKPDRSVIRLQDRHSLVCLSGSWVKPLGLRDVYEMRVACGAEVALLGYGGIASFEDAVRYAMAGADLIGVCTQTMVAGFGFLDRWIDLLEMYMVEIGATSWRRLRDRLVRQVATAADLDLYAGYAQVDEDACSACGVCGRIGHCNAIEPCPEGAPIIHIERCEACGTCVDVCPQGAIRLVEQPRR